MPRFILSILALFFALPVAAQSILPCDGWQASARNIPEPWSAHTTTFANGKIRVAVLDTIEPAAGAFYLMVVAPPYDELGSANCAIVAENDGTMGFAGLDFARIDASYDPASGLMLRVPVQLFASDTGGFDPAILAVTINQATGVIAPRYEVP